MSQRFWKRIGFGYGISFLARTLFAYVFTLLAILGTMIVKGNPFFPLMLGRFILLVYPTYEFVTGFALIFTSFNHESARLKSVLLGISNLVFFSLYGFGSIVTFAIYRGDVNVQPFELVVVVVETILRIPDLVYIALLLTVVRKIEVQEKPTLPVYMVPMPVHDQQPIQ